MDSKKQIANISLFGPDRAGVIAGVTNLLFQLGANIESLEEDVDRREFRMTLLASWTKTTLPPEQIQRDITELARKLGMKVKIHFAPRHHHRLAIFVTREDHVLKALLKLSTRQIKAQPVVVISNRPDLKSQVPKSIPFYQVPYESTAEGEKQAELILEKHQVDVIVLARFMKILSPDFVWKWKNKIINIHPSLLPAFPGAHAYRQAFNKGVKVAGVTAHLVTANLDEGPILAQEAFRIRPKDGVKEIVAKGQRLESVCTLNALKLFLSRRLDVHWGKVHEG